MAHLKKTSAVWAIVILTGVIIPIVFIIIIVEPNIREIKGAFWEAKSTKNLKIFLLSCSIEDANELGTRYLPKAS